MRSVGAHAILVLAIVGIGAVGAIGETPAPSGKEEMFRKGEERLHDLDRKIASDTGDVALRHDELRTLYFLSVADEKWLPRAESALGWLASRRRIPSDLVDAYRGAFEVVRAKHGLWPPGKLDALKRGQPLLDGAVKRSPDQVEIRYLRLMSCYYLPFFFGPSWSVREDLDALSRILPQASDSVPPGLYLKVASFVLENRKDMTPQERNRLETSRENSRRQLASLGETP